jgi:methylated-DNA-[protein]-cysteine S-methyltransferase
MEQLVGEEDMTTYYHSMPSPIGRMLLTATDAGLSGVFMQDHKGGPQPNAGWIQDDARLRNASAQLERYFEGTLREFDLTLDLQGTPFQLGVWNALRGVPYGCTASYRDLAASIGQVKAMRAVGAANGRNPISIIVPCHRVIGADGSLTGYGGGLPRKQFLLDHEARVLRGAGVAAAASAAGPRTGWLFD